MRATGGQRDDQLYSRHPPEATVRVCCSASAVQKQLWLLHAVPETRETRPKAQNGAVAPWRLLPSARGTLADCSALPMAGWSGRAQTYSASQHPISTAHRL